jgi:D-serine dehydratase
MKAESQLSIHSLLKGVPHGITDLPLASIGSRGWNILRNDLPFPVALLRQAALRHNSDWMRRFLALSGARLAPHGKTTMSPQLFQRQLVDGAWGITLATISQVQVARHFGIQRILLANQLLGDAAIDAIASDLSNDPDFDFYCLVDSAAGVAALERGLKRAGATRGLQVMVEVGVLGKRCGCRDIESALEVARAVQRAEPWLRLRGIEGFEGVISSPDPEQARRDVDAFLDRLLQTAECCLRENLFAEGPILLSAGGSQYFDLVARSLCSIDLAGRSQVLIRSGCYLTHDSLVCERLHRQLLARCPAARELGDGLRPALEVWSMVLSRPEPNRVVLGMGKRDCSFDAELPAPFLWFRPTDHSPPAALADHRIAMLHDQHAMLDVPLASPLAVGDLVACGISHPCTTFDRWQFLPIVDDDYQVVEGIRTFF